VKGWLILFAASALEIVMGVSLKYSEGWTRLWPSITGIAACGLSIFLLAIGIKSLPAGPAYAVWTGIGSVGIALYGILVFKEPAQAVRLICIAVIIAGIIGLNLTGNGH
jgi:quaternary ammonium compound-resistance protein SugE